MFPNDEKCSIFTNIFFVIDDKSLVVNCNFGINESIPDDLDIIESPVAINVDTCFN